MKREILGLCLICSVLAATCAVEPAKEPSRESAETVTATFYHTSDLHEHSAPIARIARFVEEQRAKHSNVVFLDTGDWCNLGDLTALGTRGEAIVAMMSACGYDAVIPGNNDYSHGADRLAELVDKYSVPLVLANCEWPEAIEPENVLPYRILELDGVTLAVIGTATPDMGYAKGPLFTVHPIVESVKELATELEGKADILVLLTHLGPEQDRRLARAIPNVDIIFGGHYHRKFAELNFDEESQTVIHHSGCFGEYLGDVVIEWNGEEIVNRKSRLVKIVDEMPKSDEVNAVQEKYVQNLS
jgi:2',3'-cyclic-nucleotide 2'-phosphodiesterase (5'-nucleotidase family)